MKLARDNKVDDEIPTSSMADIAFLLIIYFMVTTTFTATRGLDFALPEDDDTPPVVEKEESVLIEIQPGGNIVVDQKPMELSGVLDYLRPKLEVNPKKPVIIRPDPETAYENMIKVLDELRQAKDKGFAEEIRISIPTQREIESFWY
ncbi:MAG: biopolymer transporter ExbD [Acidobacteria bacterium]|nr:MAG: biopolymer transporter ExbD [Acidobacteriota bacterium]REK03674.1 MAG: biopolymer transporter ExbD [Acidobacteriota bacterium]